MSEDGESVALRFYKELSDDDRAKLLKLFTYLGDNGKISNREKFKKIVSDLFEFKSGQIRMPCKYLPNRVVLISHGFRKKKDDIPPAELERARRIFASDARLEGSPRTASSKNLRKWPE